MFCHLTSYYLLYSLVVSYTNIIPNAPFKYIFINGESLSALDTSQIYNFKYFPFIRTLFNT